MPLLQFFFDIANNLISAIYSFANRLHLAGGYSINPVDIYSILLLSTFIIIPVLKMVVSVNRTNSKRKYSYYQKKRGRF